MKILITLLLLFSIQSYSQKYVAKVDQQITYLKETDEYEVITVLLTILVDKDKEERKVALNYSNVVFIDRENLTPTCNLELEKAGRRKQQLTEKLHNYNRTLNGQKNQRSNN